MYVRRLGHHEILTALHLAWEVYAQDVLPMRTQEEIEEFQNFIKYENIMPKVVSGELRFYGAFEMERLCGTGAVDAQGQVFLLFVEKSMQERGLEQMLIQAMNQPSEQSTGIPSDKSKKKNKTIWIIVAAIVAVMMLIIGFFAYIVNRIVITDFDSSFVQEFDFPYGNEGQDDIPEYGEDAAEHFGGMQAIPEYIDKQADYELSEETYILNPEDTQTTRTTIAFEVHYPLITGLKDADVEAKVNEELKSCAMETVEDIYLTPTEEIKEVVLSEEYPVLASYVEYKVTYFSEDLISVTYQDYYYEGSQENYHLGFRTRTINLNDGTVYEVKDIVKLNDRFIKQWAEVMREEAADKDLLAEMNEQEMRKALSGEDVDGKYYDNFFLDENGIEIGLCFKYLPEDKDNLGYAWVTAPFDWDEIKEYKSDSDFWKLIK